VARLKALFVLLILLAAVPAFSAEKGQLKLDVVGSDRAAIKTTAQILDQSGKQVAEIAPGKTVALDPGKYKLVMPYVGGKYTKDDIKIEGGRTRTIQFTDVAILTVLAKDLEGKDPGFGVTVTGTNSSHDKVAEFITGDSILIAPTQVDVKIDAPPQGYYWHDVKLPAGRHAVIELNQQAPADLLIQPVFSGQPIDKDSRVVIYKAGTQSQVAASEPGPEHRFHLDPGDYDAYVENRSGHGQPYTTDHGIHLNSGQKVERKVSLGGEETKK